MSAVLAKGVVRGIVVAVAALRLIKGARLSGFLLSLSMCMYRFAEVANPLHSPIWLFVQFSGLSYTNCLFLFYSPFP